MKRRVFLSLGLAAIVAAGPAFAQSLTDSIVAQLRQQGFKRIQVERTLLGRTRIRADGTDGRREIILNPRTGEILRDLWTSSSSGSGGSIINGQNSGSGRVRGDDDSGSDDDGGSDDGDDKSDSGSDDGDDESDSGSGGDDSDGGGDDD